MALSKDYEIFRAAHEGDLGPLIELLQSGAEITAERRTLIIKVLRGEIKHPPNRQKRITTMMRAREIAGYVASAERHGKQMSAIADAMAKFHCSERTVKNAIKRQREVLANREELKAVTARLSQTSEGKKWLALAITKLLKEMDAEAEHLGLPKET
jgi:hypothetical protein